MDCMKCKVKMHCTDMGFIRRKDVRPEIHYFCDVCKGTAVVYASGEITWRDDNDNLLHPSHDK